MKKNWCEKFMSHFAFISEIKHALSFSVTVGCGSSSGENCTYFEVTGAVAGSCASQICASDDVCQVSPYYWMRMMKCVLHFCLLIGQKNTVQEYMYVCTYLTDV